MAAATKLIPGKWVLFFQNFNYDRAGTSKLLQGPRQCVLNRSPIKTGQFVASSPAETWGGTLSQFFPGFLGTGKKGGKTTENSTTVDALVKASSGSVGLGVGVSKKSWGKSQDSG